MILGIKIDQIKMTMGAADEELAEDQQREVTQGRSQNFSEGGSQEPRQQRRGFVEYARQCDARARMLAVLYYSSSQAFSLHCEQCASTNSHA